MNVSNQRFYYVLAAAVMLAASPFAYSGQVVAPANIDLQKRIDDISQQIIAKQGKGYFSIKEIQPDPAGNPRRVDVSDSDKAVRAEGSSRQGGDGSLTTKITRMVTDSSGSLLASLMLGDGTTMVREVELLRRNVTAAYAVSQQDTSTYLISTELPGEKIVYEMKSMFKPSAIIPNGDGTIIRFKGKVTDFFKGYTVDSDASEPLVFMLLHDTGLVHVTGKGQLTGPDGKPVKLPYTKKWWQFWK